LENRIATVDVGYWSSRTCSVLLKSPVPAGLFAFQEDGLFSYESMGTLVLESGNAQVASALQNLSH
jgi:hypothetical protein